MGYKVNYYERAQKDLAEVAERSKEIVTENTKMKRVTLDIEPEVHNVLKVLATMRHMSIKKYIMEVVTVKMLIDQRELLG